MEEKKVILTPIFLSCKRCGNLKIVYRSAKWTLYGDTDLRNYCSNCGAITKHTLTL